MKFNSDHDDLVIFSAKSIYHLTLIAPVLEQLIPNHFPVHNTAHFLSPFSDPNTYTLHTLVLLFALRPSCIIIPSPPPFFPTTTSTPSTPPQSPPTNSQPSTLFLFLLLHLHLASKTPSQ